jgi:predicted small metal-binding protein
MRGSRCAMAQRAGVSVAHWEIVCSCGHRMKADDDQGLFKKVRRHVDDVHPDLNYSSQDILDLIRDKAYTV